MDNRALVTRGACHVLRTPACALGTLAIGVLSALVLASTLVLVAGLALAASHAIVQTPALRGRRARSAARRARRTRRDQREHRLEQANVPTCELDELASIVAAIAELDEPAADDIEPLLDHYVAVSIARRRCIGVLDHGRPSQLEVQLAIARDCHPHGAELLERRVALGGAVVNRVHELDDSAAEIAELIRYYAERASLPELAPLLELDPVPDLLALDDALGAAE